MTRTVQQLFDLSGQAALVTGGSRGLGLQMAQALGEAGARVLLVARKRDELDEAAQRLQAQGIEAQWIVADCAQQTDLQRLGAEALQRLGAVDVLVNNAGAAWGAPAEEHPVEAWDKVMNLNVRGYFLLSQYLARHCMIARRRGSIINLASIAGLGGNPRGMHTIAYNTSKGAVLNFTRALAAEWGPAWHPRQRHLPGLFPQPHDARHAGGAGRGAAGCARAAGPLGRRRRPQGPDRAAGVGRGQAHHGPVAGGRWRRERRRRGLK